jgi:hypothetical protein
MVRSRLVLQGLSSFFPYVTSSLIFLGEEFFPIILPEAKNEGVYSKILLKAASGAVCSSALFVAAQHGSG